MEVVEHWIACKSFELISFFLLPEANYLFEIFLFKKVEFWIFRIVNVLENNLNLEYGG